MTSRFALGSVWLCFALLLFGASEGQSAPIPIAAVSRPSPVEFDRDILPLLRRNCLACHNATEKQGALVLETVPQIVKGGDSGPAIVAGKSGESLLLKLAAHEADPVMPPAKNDVAAKPLTSDELGLIKLWIDQGARAGQGGAPSPKTFRSLPSGVHPIHAVALTSDGQYAAASRGNQILVYHVPSGQLVTQLADPALRAESNDSPVTHRDIVQSLALSPDGSQLASGAFREVKLWRRPRDIRVANLAGPSELSVVTASPDRSLMATGGIDGLIQIRETATGKPIRDLAGHTGPVSGLRFSPAGTELISVSQDKSLRVWNVADGTLLQRFDVPNPLQAVEWVRSAANPPGPGQAADYLVTASATEPFLRVWRAPGSAAPAAAPWKNVPPQIVASASTPDHKHLVTAAADGTLRVFDTATKAAVETWKGSDKPPTAIAAGPLPGQPGTMVATGDEQGRIEIWSPGPDGRRVTSALGGVAARVQSLALSPDGKSVLAGTADGTLTLWNVEPLPPKEVAAIGPDKVTASALDPNGQRIALATLAGGAATITIRSTESGQVLATLAGHTGAVTSLAFSPDASRLVSGSSDQTARVWSLTDNPPKEVAKFAEHQAEVKCVGFNAGSAQVISGAANNTVRIWSAVDGKLVVDCPGHTAPVVAAFFGAGDQPVTASADQSVRFWNAANGQQARAFTEPVPIAAMSRTRDGNRLAIALNDGSIVLRNFDGNQTHQLKGHAAPVRELYASIDNTRLLSLDTAGRAILWDIAAGRLLETVAFEGAQVAILSNTSNQLFAAGTDGLLRLRTLRYLGGTSTGVVPITTVAFRPDGQLVYAASTDGTFRGYGPTTLHQPAFQQNHGAAIHAIALSADNQFLATAGEDKQIRLWNTSGGGVNPAQLGGFSGPVRSVVFSADGQRVLGASAGDLKEILVFNRQDGAIEQSLVGQAGPADFLARTPVPDYYIAVARDAGIRTWEATALRRIPGSGGAINAIVACPEVAGQVFTGSDDGTIRRWNVDNGGQLAQYNHGGGVKAIAVRPDGQRVAGASDNHVIKLWHINGQQQPEMRGDLRTRTAAARTQQLQQAAQSRRDTLKQLLAQAEQDLPNKTNAAKAASDALAAANKSVEEKSAAVKMTLEAKTAAEKLAIELAAASQKAILARTDAEQFAAKSAMAAKTATDRSTRLAQLAAATPEDAALKQSADAAQTAAQAANTTSQQATAAVAAPTQAAQQAITAANDAAQKAIATQKPWSDAVLALKTAETQQNLTAQQNAIAARELDAATKLVPEAKAKVEAAEAALVTAQKAVEAANQVATTADQGVRSLDFSPDGRTLISAGDYPALQGWDGETGAALASFEGHQGPVRGVAFLSATHVASVSADKSLSTWEVNPGWTLERTIGSAADPATFAHRVLALDFSDDGQLLACGGGEPSRSGEIKVVRVADGQPVLSIPEAHSDTVFSLQFSADGKRLASGGADRYLRTFDVAAGTPLRRFEGHTHHVLGVAWKTDGSLLVTASADQTFKTWNAETGDQVVTMTPNAKLCTAVRFIGETNNIVTTNSDGIPRMYRANDGGLFVNLNAVSDYLHCVDVTPNQQTVIAGGHRGTLYIWNGQNGQLLHQLGPGPK